MTARILVKGAGTPEQKQYVLVDGDVEFPSIELSCAQAEAVADLVESLIGLRMKAQLHSKLIGKALSLPPIWPTSPPNQNG